MQKVAYTLTEAAAAVGLSPKTVRKLVREGVIKARRGPRGIIFIPYGELHRYVEALPPVAGGAK